MEDGDGGSIAAVVTVAAAGVVVGVPAVVGASVVHATNAKKLSAAASIRPSVEPWTRTTPGFGWLQRAASLPEAAATAALPVM